MTDPADHLQTVGEIVQGLRALGLEPVLVGGMALVVLGSRRVTRDFDIASEQDLLRLKKIAKAARSAPGDGPYPL